MGRLYQVHEFAELAGVTVKALHHYERLGLLNPRRTDAGYRVYALHDLERLRQIVALKFLGLPLKQMKVLLGRETRLADVLRSQRRVLEEQRCRLDRAIGALQGAEEDLDSGALPESMVLTRLVEVIVMNEATLSEDWLELYRDVEASLGEDPACEAVQALVDRWVALERAGTPRDRAIRAGLMRTWAGRERWPAPLRQRMAALNLEAITRFMWDAGWIRFEIEGRRHGAPPSMAPARVGQSRLALFREIEAVLGEDPAGKKAKAIVARWSALLREEAGGDQEAEAILIQAWAGRRSWPAAARQWAASLYATNLETWEKVAGFIEQATGQSR